MNNILRIMTAMIIGVAGNMVSAASQDECAIWLCLPGGFPSGCGSAHSAMVHRIEHARPPLPGFGECAVNPPSGSGSHMSSDWGVAAYIPTHLECVQNNWDDSGCARYEEVPESYVRGRMCRVDWENGTSDPMYCTRTVRWIEVLIENQLAGPTYYW